jgi:hypothetical protein
VILNASSCLKVIIDGDNEEVRLWKTF